MITGVPQGSVLGPLLFHLFTNDVEHCIPDCTVLAYSDGTKFFFTGNTSDKVEKTACRILSQLHLWTEINRLRINANETKYMLFRAKTLQLNLT